MSSQTSRFHLDRVESGFAVLISPDGVPSVDLPVECLPAEAREGVSLTMTVSVDEQATQDARAGVAELMEELQG